MSASRVAVLLLLTAALLAAAGEIWAGDDPADAADAWRRLKSIDAAIAVRPLDGPEDIQEKAEIIADRLDELSREEKKLNLAIDQNQQILQSLRTQKEVLQDLSEMQQGRDSQTLQRKHELTERIQQQEKLLKQQTDSRGELLQEKERLKNILDQYQKKADALRQHEGGTP